ncbi:Trypsin domain containing protein [Trichuris trichiura]|uniref:Trypsin domain containing protein n=1 Tax=Trichuris trichiura TaxID=36087 RepID=A0A077ZAG7_TRITR|nr:Trypsin domain containing protein [Trichuris trichiura]
MAILIAAAMVIVHIVQSCGIPAIRPLKKPPKASPNRIVNGWEAKPHSLPWMVMILLTYGRRYVTCSGFLIENGMQNETDIVLTATHCLHIEGIYQPPGNMFFLVGAHNVENLTDAVQRRARTYLTHFYKSTNDDNDIAMIRLNKPVTYGSHISPLCLPGDETPKVENGECFAAGWGTTERELPVSALQDVLLPKCFRKGNEFSTKSDFFIRPVRRVLRSIRDNKQAVLRWSGDSGSPLFCEIEGRYFALGILSHGAINCTENVPATYTRLSAYGQWINSSLSQLRKAPYQTEHTQGQGTIFIPKRTRLPGMLWSGGQQEFTEGSSLIALLSGYHKRRTA